jgi:hypothetical protein
MKRLPVVAIGVAALCALATGAQARPDDMQSMAFDRYRPYSEGDWEYREQRPARRSARPGKRRTAAVRPGRRQAVRSVRRRQAAPTRRSAPVAARGLIDFSRGGLSRACLTPAARDLLARIEAQFGPVGIVSTCRPGAVIAGTGRLSRHASGNAVDFNAPAGRKSEVVQWLIANHHTGGVMTYSNMHHIHVDIGRHFVALGADAGGRGRWR